MLIRDEGAERVHIRLLESGSRRGDDAALSDKFGHTMPTREFGQAVGPDDPEHDRIGIDEHQRRVADLYPSWSESLRQSIAEEQGRFVEGVLFDGEGTLKALFTSNRGYVNRSLAELYGVDGPADLERARIMYGVEP